MTTDLKVGVARERVPVGECCALVGHALLKGAIHKQAPVADLASTSTSTSSASYNMT